MTCAWIAPASSLIGVFVGGLITYLIQRRNYTRQKKDGVITALDKLGQDAADYWLNPTSETAYSVSFCITHALDTIELQIQTIRKDKLSSEMQTLRQSITGDQFQTKAPNTCPPGSPKQKQIVTAISEIKKKI